MPVPLETICELVFTWFIATGFMDLVISPLNRTSSSRL